MDDHDEARKEYVKVYTKLIRQQKALSDKESGLLIDARSLNKRATLDVEKRRLIKLISQNGRYSGVRKFIDEFFKHGLIPKNFYLIRRVTKLKSGEKLTENDYMKDKRKYDWRVKNRLKTFNRLIEPLGYIAEFKSNSTELIRIGK